jgi:hypothetical protein
MHAIELIQNPRPARESVEHCERTSGWGIPLPEATGVEVREQPVKPVLRQLGARQPDAA